VFFAFHHACDVKYELRKVFVFRLILGFFVLFMVMDMFVNGHVYSVFYVFLVKTC